MITYSRYALLLAADLLTKTWAVENLATATPFIFNIFRLRLVLNTGIATSLLANFGVEHQLQLIIFNTLILAAFAIFTRGQIKRKKNILPEMLVCTGGLGNLFSRIYYNGVVDFLEVKVLTNSSSVFNLADIYISVGIFLILARVVKNEFA